MPRPSLPDPEAAATPAAAKQLLADRAVAPVAQPAPPQAPKVDASMANKAVARATAVTGQEAPSPSPRPPGAQQPQLVNESRPTDITKWQPADFHAARAARDPALLRAVAWLAETAPGDVANGQLLAELLELRVDAEVPVAIDPDADVPSAVNSARAFPALTPLVLAALASNRSTMAEQALSKALLGKVQADVDPRVLLSQTLTALAKHPCAEHHRMLARVVESPEKFRAAGYPDHTAQIVFGDALRAAGLSASPELRAQLAALAATGAVPPERSRELQRLVAGPEVENLQAGLILYRASLGDPAARMAYERRVQQYSSQAFDTLLRMPAASAATQLVSLQRQEGDDPATADDAALAVARQLWTPACGEAIARRLSASEDLIKDRDIVLCAMNLPIDSVRTELFRALERRWEEGRARVTGGGTSNDLEVIRDPAVLIALKSLPRFEEEPKAAKKSRRSVARKGRNTRAKSSPAVQAKAVERKAKFELTRLSAELAIDFNKRFHAAAQATPLSPSSLSDIAGGQGADDLAAEQPTNSIEEADRGLNAELDLEGSDSEGDETDDQKLAPTMPAGKIVRGVPFPLHKDAEVRAEYHLDWPQELAEKLPGVPISPLKVHYVRIEAKARFSALHGYYRRQLEDAVSRVLERGKWLDDFARDAETKLCTSTDIIISGTNYVRAAAKAPEERLVVEILIVQAKDPRDG